MACAQDLNENLQEVQNSLIRKMVNKDHHSTCACQLEARGKSDIEYLRITRKTTGRTRILSALSPVQGGDHKSSYVPHAVRSPACSAHRCGQMRSWDVDSTQMGKDNRLIDFSDEDTVDTTEAKPKPRKNRSRVFKKTKQTFLFTFAAS